MLSLAVYYSIYETQVVGTFNPKGDLEAYRAKLEEYPTLTCDCQRQSIPFKEFAEPIVKVNNACDWVETDLSNGTLSSCRVLKLTGYCVSVREACRQSNATIEWILNEFDNAVVSSTTLMQETPLRYSTNASLMGNFKVGELIAASPKKTVKAWASANMPRIMTLVGDLAMRVKAQTKKVRYLYDGSDDEFAQECAAARPIVCRGNHDYDDDYALLNGGDLPEDCVRDDVTPSCDITKVADGECHPECMSPECLFDGGDCANRDPSHKDKDLRDSFTLLDAFFTLDEYILDQDYDYLSSWMDNIPSAYSNFTRRRCDDSENWAETEYLPKDADLYGSKFAGYDFSDIVSLLGVNKYDADWPLTAEGEKVEFRAAQILGCDQYEKELKENLFHFYSVDEFDYFMAKMRIIAGAESTGSSAPDTWTCEEDFYDAGDGCDCNCGAWDPDCSDPSADVYGCASGGCLNEEGLGICEFGTPDYDYDYDYSKKRRSLLQGAGAYSDYQNYETVVRNFFDRTKDVYKKRGVDYLENFAAPLTKKHTNLENAMDNLFVDLKDMKMNYTQYFEACKVTSCTYTYMSASSIAGVAAVIIGLLGGINNAMNATFKAVYSVSKGIIVPKPGAEDSKNKEGETPATEVEEAHASRKNSPV